MVVLNADIPNILTGEVTLDASGRLTPSIVSYTRPGVFLSLTDEVDVNCSDTTCPRDPYSRDPIVLEDVLK